MTSSVKYDFVGFDSFLTQCLTGDRGFDVESTKVNYRASVSTPSRFNLKKSGVLIEGDSLLLHFLCMGFDDGSRLVDCTYGASSLHLCYLVNQHLETFATHDVRVTVVFFQDHCTLYANRHYLLLRRLVMRSMRDIDASFGITVLEFPSFLSGGFDAYLSSRMREFVPLELMLFKPELAINTSHGQIMLNAWGVAVGNIAQCDLAGTCEIRDVVRENRVCADLKLEVDPEAERSERYYTETCAESIHNIHRLLTAPANISLKTKKKGKSKVKVDDKAIEAEPIALPLPSCFSLDLEGVSRVNYKAFIDLISTLGVAYPQFVQSHLEAVDVMRTTHPKDRIKFYLAETVLALKSDVRSAFERYCTLLTDRLLAMASASGDREGVKGDVSTFNGDTLFVGDLWDGRLLVSVHLKRCPEDLDEEILARPSPAAFIKPYAIKSTLVDSIKRVAAVKFTDVKHVADAADPEDRRPIHSGVGGDMPVELHTHTHQPLDAPYVRKYNTQNFYRECGFDFFDMQRNVAQPAVRFAEATESKQLATSTVATTNRESTSSAPSVCSEDQEDATSGGYVDGESLAELLKRQGEMNTGAVSDLEHSGLIQLAAVAKGKEFTPLGPARQGWQELSISNSTTFSLLSPRYNAVTTNSGLEAALAKRYLFEDGFRPEPWQLRMLQSIEQNRSVLIMAPTSSGKTLAAKYAMRKVCRDNMNIALQSQKGRGIFVQPTNALVNQTFGSFLADPNVGISKVAMFTAEVRSPNFNDGSYEVLITNPQCLHILLTSGHSMDRSDCFYQRLRAVVFDEVHSIGQDDGSSGVIWEQLLATVDCPIIGLSATLADAEPFYQWLCSTKAQQLEHKGEVVPHNGVVDRLVHTERSTPLHYFITHYGASAPLLAEERLHPLQPVADGAMLKFERDHLLRIKCADTLSSWPIKKMSFSWFHQECSSSCVGLRLFNADGICCCHIVISSDQLVARKECSQYRLTILQSDSESEQLQEQVSSDAFWWKKSERCWVGLAASFSGSTLKLKVVGNRIGEHVGITVNHKVNLADAVVGKMEMDMEVRCKTDCKTIDIESCDIQPVEGVADDAFAVFLAKPDQYLEINPLQFLPSFDHHSDSQLAGFFEAVPHIKLADIQALVVAMQSSSILSSFVDVQCMSRHVCSDLCSGVDAAYSSLRHLISTQRQLPEPLDVDGLQQYAQFRLDFSKLIADMHCAILMLPSLLDRIYMDAMCAYSLRNAGIDWYGQQWLDGFTSLDTLEDVEEEFRKYLQNCTGWESIIMSSLNKITASLFANDIEGAYELPNSYCVYPSSVTAVNRGLYYFLHLLLKRDIAFSSKDCEELIDRTAEEVHSDLIRILTPKQAKSTNLSKDKFKSATVAGILRNLLVNNCEEIGPPKNLDDGTTVKEVKQPTLIFHLDKQKLDKFIEDLTGDLLGSWFGSEAHKGCFLTPTEIAEINALPNTSEVRKLGLLFGIGLHVAVVKEGRQYRSAVEKLFQNKKLLFVFATTSLSYGINMPCSKVVFLGDSPHLSNMVFRQSSGRAGRRGHMSGAGNIYFVGFTQLSIIRKLCTPIDSLVPRQAVSPAYILKLTSVSATCHQNNRQWVDHMALQGLVNPLFERLLAEKVVIRKQFRTALLNSIHFSWSFLAERGFINSAGVAQVKASLPYRVHYLEPRCFLLAELFDSFLNPENSGSTMGLLGLVHNDATDAAASEKQLDLDVFMVLVYLASYSFVDPGNPQVSAYSLPECVRAAWEKYNEEVTHSLVSFMRSHSVIIAEEQFPMNPCAFASHAHSETAGGDNAAVQARSCFTVSSGLGDEFRSIQEMALSVKKGVIIDSRVIPTTDIQYYVNRTLVTTFQEGQLYDCDRNAETTCESFSRHLRGVVTQLEHMYNALTAEPEAASKAQLLMQSFQRVKTKFLFQFKRAKKTQFCLVRKGIVTLVDSNICRVHYYNEDLDQLCWVDVNKSYQGCGVDWKVLDCVQFNQPKDLDKWMNVTYVEHLRHEDGSVITAAAYKGRVTGCDDDLGEISVLWSSKADDDRKSLEFLIPPALPIWKNYIADVVFSPSVFKWGLATVLKIVGIAAKFRSDVVNSIYYLNGGKLYYVSMGMRSLQEGDIVEFTRTNVHGNVTDVKVLKVPRALKAVAPLRSTLDTADFSRSRTPTATFPANFECTDVRILNRTASYKFLYSPFVSDGEVSFLICQA